MSNMDEWRELAKKAIKKRAPFGRDLNISAYRRTAKDWEKIPLTKLPEDIKKSALLAGIDIDEKLRCGTYFQLDHSVVFEHVKEQFKGKVEVMSVKEAINKYDWVRDYWWKAVPVDLDKYTATAELELDNGYFIRVLPNQKVIFPLQACLLLSQDGISQNVHNIIIAEEGSDVQIITGCTATAKRGLHIGISEFYVKRNAKLTFTMIHRWSSGIDARPRAVAIVEDGATFINNYICLNPVSSLQLYPTAICIGNNSSASLNSIILGAEDSEIDVGGRVILRGKDCKGFVLTRAVAKDRAKIYARGHIIGENQGRGHIDCRGIIVSDEAKIYAIPQLDGVSKHCELSHEAAVGKIREEELWYLMSRKLTEEEAISLIVKGYLDPGIFGLPKVVEDEIKKIVELTVKEVM